MNLWNEILEADQYTHLSNEEYERIVLEANKEDSDEETADVDKMPEVDDVPDEADTDESDASETEDADGGNDSGESTDDTTDSDADSDMDTSSDESNDNDSDSGGVVDSSGDSTGTETEPSQDESKNAQINKVALLDNYIHLYRLLKNVLKKLAESRKDNILASVTFNQVRVNVERLSGIVYNYILFFYDKNEHALNLYNFKYFKEILELNIEMVRKVTNTKIETETSI